MIIKYVYYPWKLQYYNLMRTFIRLKVFVFVIFSYSWPDLIPLTSCPSFPFCFLNRKMNLKARSHVMFRNRGSSMPLQLHCKSVTLILHKQSCIDTFYVFYSQNDVENHFWEIHEKGSNNIVKLWNKFMRTQINWLISPFFSCRYLMVRQLTFGV